MNFFLGPESNCMHIFLYVQCTENTCIIHVQVLTSSRLYKHVRFPKMNIKPTFIMISVPGTNNWPLQFPNLKQGPIHMFLQFISCPYNAYKQARMTEQNRTNHYMVYAHSLCTFKLKAFILCLVQKDVRTIVVRFCKKYFG